MRDNKEYQLHKSVCDYLRLQYSQIVFNSDMSGLNLSKVQRGQAKQLRSSRGFPDLFVLEPSDQFTGLMLEFKKESPYDKNGKLKKQTVKEYKKVRGVKVCIGSYDHLKEQQEMHDKLNAKGYVCFFVWDFNQAVDIINNYLR